MGGRVDQQDDEQHRKPAAGVEVHIAPPGAAGEPRCHECCNIGQPVTENGYEERTTRHHNPGSHGGDASTIIRTAADPVVVLMWAPVREAVAFDHLGMGLSRLLTVDATPP
ncbi:hypothetical protein GCM10020218_038470 [Dactylosporangium vinaceum]